MQKGIVWSIEPSLSISVSVTDDASPQTWSFHLDRLLPRVCDLALQSTNRRIKVALTAKIATNKIRTMFLATIVLLLSQINWLQWLACTVHVTLV